MGEFTVTGGARVGWVNATGPLARLSVSAKNLTLSVLIVGRYDFAPDQVIALERYGFIPVLASGVRILHARMDYPEKIVFWCRGNPEKLIQRIGDTGFSPSASPGIVTSGRGFPIKWQAIVFVIFAWNTLLLADFSRKPIPHPPGIFSICALLLAFLFGWRTKVSPWLQRFVLRDGHSVEEIKPVLSLLQFVSGFMLLVFAALLASGVPMKFSQ